MTGGPSETFFRARGYDVEILRSPEYSCILSVLQDFTKSHPLANARLFTVVGIA